MKVVENAILSTDLAVYFKKRDAFLDVVENGEFDWQSEEKKECMFNKYSIVPTLELSDKINCIFLEN